MSCEEKLIVTTDRNVIRATLTKNDVTFEIDTGSIVTAKIVDEADTASAVSTALFTDAGNTWSQSQVQFVFQPADAAALIEGSGTVEITVDDGGPLTWFIDDCVIRTRH